MQNSTLSADHARTISAYVIPRSVAPQSGVLVWGANIPGTHIVPAYKADGSLWFVSGKLPADGSIIIDPLPDLAPEPTDAEKGNR